MIRCGIEIESKRAKKKKKKKTVMPLRSERVRSHFGSSASSLFSSCYKGFLESAVVGIMMKLCGPFCGRFHDELGGDDDTLDDDNLTEEQRELNDKMRNRNRKQASKKKKKKKNCHAVT
uniref:Uncharacterized protein n=1 Tax=Akashiwo sanguinea TaxID=143672 RepID=A0A7S2QWR9_9DINO|mmetsp:Transcript_554/g.330  ORF Transcript_554/g.330 Transcript_554/m.330 type:complete len:119 (+) Transcript_554:122-478(+)